MNEDNEQEDIINASINKIQNDEEDLKDDQIIEDQ